jgi:hypothetical protein
MLLVHGWMTRLLNNLLEHFQSGCQTRPLSQNLRDELKKRLHQALKLGALLNLCCKPVIEGASNISIVEHTRHRRA